MTQPPDTTRNTSANSSSREFAGRIVVGAGKTVTTFRDRKKTFTEASLFSSAAFDGPSKEAEADVLRLLQEELQLFSTIIQAVYHGGFDFLVYADMNFRT